MNSILPDIEEFSRQLAEAEAHRSVLFFKAIGIEDDNRLNPTMTREEFRAFCKNRACSTHVSNRRGEFVEIYYEFAPYHDISYTYCFDDDTVYEHSFYIGD